MKGFQDWKYAFQFHLKKRILQVVQIELLQH